MSQRLPTEIASSYQSYVAFVTMGLERINKPIGFDAMPFYLENKDRLVSIVISGQKIKDKERAKDIVQDLYIAIREKSIFHNLENENHALRLSISWCKYRLKEVMQRYRYEKADPDYVFDREDKTDSIKDNIDLVDLIKSRFSLLTNRQLKYVNLQFIEGLSAKEIALKFGVTSSSVNSTTTSAINRLRNSFDLESKSRKIDKKSVEQYTLSGNLIATYPSLKEASIKTGVNVGSIHKVCEDRGDSGGGFLWEYTLV